MSRAIKKAEFCSSINKADPIFTNGVQKTRVISAKTLSYAWTKLNGKMTSKETLSGKWIDDNIKSEEIYLLDSVTYHTSQVGGSHQDILEYSYYMYIYAERERERALGLRERRKSTKRQRCAVCDFQMYIYRYERDKREINGYCQGSAR